MLLVMVLSSQFLKIMMAEILLEWKILEGITISPILSKVFESCILKKEISKYFG